MAAENTWLRIRDAAKYLGMSERWVRRQMRDGQLPFHKVGDRQHVVLFRRSELDTWVASHDAAAPAAESEE